MFMNHTKVYEADNRPTSQCSHPYKYSRNTADPSCFQPLEENKYGWVTPRGTPCLATQQSYIQAPYFSVRSEIAIQDCGVSAAVPIESNRNSSQTIFLMAKLPSIYQTAAKDMVGRTPIISIPRENTIASALSQEQPSLLAPSQQAQSEFLASIDHGQPPQPMLLFYSSPYGCYSAPYYPPVGHLQPSFQLAGSRTFQSETTIQLGDVQKTDQRVGFDDRSRSRSRGGHRDSKSPKRSSNTEKKSSATRPSVKKDRPQKFMMKVIFTPLKRIFRNYRLKELGIDMDDYFRVRGEPYGGHRTPADIELVMWYVEQKYRNTPGIYERFVEYLVAHRRDLEHYGQEAYGEGYPEEWLVEYNKLLKTIFRAIETPGGGRARFLNLYTRRPSEQSFHNLRELKEQFYTQRIIAREPQSSE